MRLDCQILLKSPPLTSLAGTAPVVSDAEQREKLFYSKYWRVIIIGSTPFIASQNSFPFGKTSNNTYLASP